MAQIQDISTPDSNEIMANDLEKAQRHRFSIFDDADRNYDFFLQAHELEVLEQIHELRGRAQFPIGRRRRPVYDSRGRG